MPSITITDLGGDTYRVDGLTGGNVTFRGVDYIQVNTLGGKDTVTLVGGPDSLELGAYITGQGNLTVTNVKFNTADEVSKWRFDFGGVYQSAVFDPTVDADNNAQSGSMKISLDFNSDTLMGNNKGAYTHDFNPGLDATEFSGLAMDISCGGIGMVAERRFERGTILKIEVQGKHEGPPSLLIARVVHVGPNADGKWVLGCQFPSAMDKEDVRDFLNECQRIEARPAEGAPGGSP